MSIEVMKQALEALDIGLEYAESELYENRRRYEGYMHLAPDDQAYVNQIKETITSLRQAIEQAEKPFYKVEGPLHVVCQCDKCKAQPQREQVMYQLSPTDIYDFAGWLTTRKGLMQVGGAYEAGPMAEAVGEYLKTFPERFATAQREWVGLTLDEIALISQDYPNPQGFALAIQAKLRSKNT